MDIYNENLFAEFIKDNPLKFSNHRMELVRKDFYGQHHGTVSDEFADYVLWAEKLPARHEKFGTFLLPIIRDNRWKSILEVGSGENALLSLFLRNMLEENIKITAMDKCVITCDNPNINIINREFTCKEKLTDYNAVIAQEPCDAAEPIIRACTDQNIPYCVILCGVPHTRLTGILDTDVYEWYAYLIKTYPGSRFTKWRNGRFSSWCIYSENGFDEKYFQGIAGY